MNNNINLNRLNNVNYKLTQNYKMGGGGVYLTINKRNIDKINKDYEITNRNISDFS